MTMSPSQPATLVERIVRREPEGWLGLSDLLEHAQELAAIAPGRGTVPEAVAERIRRAFPDGLVAMPDRQNAP